MLAITAIHLYLSSHTAPMSLPSLQHNLSNSVFIFLDLFPAIDKRDTKGRAFKNNLKKFLKSKGENLKINAT